MRMIQVCVYGFTVRTLRVFDDTAEALDYLRILTENNVESRIQSLRIEISVYTSRVFEDTTEALDYISKL